MIAFLIPTGIVILIVSVIYDEYHNGRFSKFIVQFLEFFGFYAILGPLLYGINNNIITRRDYWIINIIIELIMIVFFVVSAIHITMRFRGIIRKYKDKR